MFDFKTDKSFVADLVAKIAADIPPDLMAGQGRVMTVNRITRLLERAFHTAEQYKAEHKPGYFRRVLMVNSFKWGLKSRGYKEEFVNIATEGLIVSLVRKGK